MCPCSNVLSIGNTDAQQEASNFLYYIGLKKNCNIKYNTDGSSGWADGAKRTFKNMGYKSVNKYLGFEKADKNRAISQLTSGFPMYMDGSRKGGGHAFVLDGLYTRKVYGETDSLQGLRRHYLQRRQPDTWRMHFQVDADGQGDCMVG